MHKKALMALALAGTFATANSAVLLSENFENVGGLSSSGWVFTNASSSPLNNWMQGQEFPGLLSAQEGNATSFMVANATSNKTSGVISNWLITPKFSLENSGILNFFLRTDAYYEYFTDQLEVRFSTAGASSALSDFGTSLLSINANAEVDGIPDGWTSYSANFAGLGAGTSGRLAFVYGGNSDFANLVALDTVSIQSVPEPTTYALLGLGLLGLGLMRRRSN